jgi:hypothetical protein
MKTFTIGFGSLILLSSISQAQLNLRADSQKVKDKAQAIEQAYSQDRREGEALNQPTQTIQPMAPSSRTEVRRNVTQDIQQDMRQELNMGTAGTSYSSNLKMRETRKVGVGAAVGGTLGLAGINLEFNFEDADGVVAGFGTGPGYNSFGVAWKHNFEGDYISPYTTVGYSRWYNSSGGKDAAADSDILNRVLTDSEKRSGQFGADFITGALGLQYNQLSGELAGVSFYGELVGLIEVKRSQFLPAGSVGALYYF